MSRRRDAPDWQVDTQSAAASTTSKPLRSPRMHIAGEAPPELSPLDAFALQSRLLAKQLQESSKSGNRISRLPPLTVESPLIMQGRSDYFRSMSAEPPSDTEPESPELSPGLGLKTEVEDAFTGKQRPKSMHPRMSRIPPTPGSDGSAVPDHGSSKSRDGQVDFAWDKGDFGAGHDRSPSPLRSDKRSQREKTFNASPVRDESSARAASCRRAQISTGSPERTKRGSFDELGLVPPPSLFTNRSPSVLSSTVPEDDEMSSKMSSSFQSLPRKLSSGSTAVTNAVASPAMSSSYKRSPSVASDSSARPRPSFNFSRPISRASTPGLDMPTRQASSDSQPSFIMADETANTPISMHSEAFIEQQQADDGKVGASSYIYSTFALPRGKSVQRSEPHEGDSQTSHASGAPPSPPTRSSSSSVRTGPDDTQSNVSGETRPSTDALNASPNGLRLVGRKSDDTPRGRTLTSALHEPAQGRVPTSTGTSDSASTIRPNPTPRSHILTASEMSPEENLAKGIECHEKGSLNKSTYHLRLAARQNNPTAMLLYALACRHGWGMRANQREGVEWLRKAAEYASIEIADDEDQVKEGRAAPANVLERRSRKAQFALSIYELGVSHMNGWGIEQDRSLALRCFEIAGTWGDVDALAEAGFCYAQGLGCKKNLKKSAKFYRMAEAKGMSMVGNSWIHKAKYDEDEKTSPSKDRKKTRSKSRTRARFGLKA